MPHVHASRRGFSLVELLVVIGIISLLLTITLPVLGRIRESAARVKCAAKLTDVARAFQSYLNDSGGKLPKVNPLPLQNPALFPGPPLWDAFGSYQDQNREAWRCPSDTVINRSSAFPSDKDSYFAAYGVSYEYNFWMNSFYGGDRWTDALAMAREVFNVGPSEFRIFNDFSHFHGRSGRPGNMNFLFADWSVGDLGSSGAGIPLSQGNS
jgi:prepilin-type N-terminal cleavage/methylation domain-containing protein/prepilin-type processing-associated H-X9-DG protein